MSDRFEKTADGIRKDYPWFYPVILGFFLVLLGVAIGAWLFGSDSPVMNGNMLAYSTNLWTEGIGIVVTIVVLNQFNRQRDIENLKRLLIRNVKSNIRDVAVHAINELRAEEWLTGEDGILKGQDIDVANLEQARLGEANLQGTRLMDANLQGAHLLATNLQGAMLVKADLQGAVLSQANLQGAILVKANLQGAYLWYTNLQGAHLVIANLQGADLSGANLQGADLRLANLEGANLDRVQFNEKTVLPDTDYLKDKAGNIVHDEKRQTIFDKYWRPDTDMSRYTDSNHPDFWQPDWVQERPVVNSNKGVLKVYSVTL